MNSVEIITGARLHFGPLSVEAPGGGRFGGVGVMIDSPSVVLSARLAEKDAVLGEAKAVARVLDFVQRIRQTQPTKMPSALEVTIKQSIPSHCGLGSGTQLGLAVARAIATLSNEADPPLDKLAQRVGRGLRSAIGLHGFARGGFLVDGGRLDSNQLGTLVARVDFPEEWRFVLAAPKQTFGLSGEAEQSAFARQPSMPVFLTAELCRNVLMDLLPAVIEADFSRCSESLFQFGQRVGEFFSIAQGGIFANRRMSEWVALLRRNGISGAAQTSWGPTVAVLCSSEAAARQLQGDFAENIAWNDCTFNIVSPLNRGAQIRVA